MQSRKIHDTITKRGEWIEINDIEKIIRIYDETGSIKQTARLATLSEQTVRKRMIAAGAYDSPLYRSVTALAAEGKTVDEIMQILNLSRSTVFSYLSYVKGCYNSSTPSGNALRIRKHRAKLRGAE